MALRWLVHSARNVWGHSDNNIEDDHGDMTIKKSKIEEDCMDMNPSASGFQMPLHYPRYTKADYEKMEEWRVDLLLKQYGLNFKGTLDEKRAFAMGAFLWPDQY